MEDVENIYDCFFVVHEVEDSVNILFIHPTEYEDPALKQLFKFCFPFDSINSMSSSIAQRNQHFTFMLTDLEKRHRYGFCKLTNGGTTCYCFMSYLPWFEVFYKLLNCVFELHNSSNDVTSMFNLLEKLYYTKIPLPNEIVQISTSMTFNTPLSTTLPSIPESRNVMEYYSACNSKMMMEIFAALMYERRVIITASSLSILAGCVFAAETLLHPLKWQHIYIPILPPHVLDYCTAPIPYLIGIHSSLMSSVSRKIDGDECGIVIVNVDEKCVKSPFHDLDTMPSDSMTFLKSQLHKPNIAVGNHLAMAFLRTQARLIGGYRNALKFRSGESIIFDEQAYIDSNVVKSKRNFAESVVQLQTFKEFVDQRLVLLNNGIGFRDDFENEINAIQEQDGNTQGNMYKDWITVKQKGGEFITSMKRKAKENYKTAKQSMKDAAKPYEQESQHPLQKRQSLKESIKSLRPPRPSPPKPARTAPPRPPPPKLQGGSVRKYKVIDFDEEEEFNNVKDDAETGNINHSNTILVHDTNDEIIQSNDKILSDDLLIDFDLNSSINAPPTISVTNEMDLLSLIDSTMANQNSPTLSPTLLQPTCISTRPAYQISRDKLLSPEGEVDPVDLFGFSWSANDVLSTKYTDLNKPRPESVTNDFFSFDNNNATQENTSKSILEFEKPSKNTSDFSNNNENLLVNFDDNLSLSDLPPPLLPK